jgi:O-antigen ligase
MMKDRIYTSTLFENAIKKYLYFIIIAFPYLYSYMPFLEMRLGISSPFIIALFYFPFFVFGVFYCSYIPIKRVVPYILLVLVACLAISWSLEPSRGLVNVYLMVGAIFISYSIVFLKNSKIIWALYSWNMLFFCLLLDSGILYKGMNAYNFGGNRLGYVEGDFALDPNFIALWIGLGLFHFLNETQGLSLKGNIKPTALVKKCVYLLATILSFIYLCKTVSRTAIIAIIVAFILVVIIKRRYITAYISIFLSLIVLFMYVNDFGGIRDLFPTNRFNELDSDSRFTIWKLALNVFWSDLKTLLFGFGFGSSDLILGKVYDDAVIFSDGKARFSAHNVYVDWLLQTGVLGILFLIVFIVWVILKSIHYLKCNEYSVFEFSIYISLVSMGINLIGNYSWPIIFGIYLSFFIGDSKSKLAQNLTKIPK